MTSWARKTGTLMVFEEDSGPLARLLHFHLSKAQPLEEGTTLGSSKKRPRARSSRSTILAPKSGGKEKHRHASIAPAKLDPHSLLPSVPLTSQQRSWFMIEGVRIRRALKEMDGSPKGEYGLLKATIRGCYPPPVIAEPLALQLAAGELLGDEYSGLALTAAQLKSFPRPLHDARTAIQYLKYTLDCWASIDFSNPFVRDSLLDNLRIVMETFDRRASGESIDLDKEFGLTAGGRGQTSELSASRLRDGWSENCFDIHLLHLSGKTIEEACNAFLSDKDGGKKTASEPALVKQYWKWRNDPITSVRLQLGDELAMIILARRRSKEIIAKRFPPSST
jgi:hypothetical protein